MDSDDEENSSDTDDGTISDPDSQSDDNVKDGISTDSDLPDEDDNVGNVGHNKDPFHVDADANGMQRRIGEVSQLECFLMELAKNLGSYETYKSMYSTFEFIKIMHPDCQLLANNKSFWRIVNRRSPQYMKVYRCGVCWNDLGPRKKYLRNCECGICGRGRDNSTLTCTMIANIGEQLKVLLRKRGMASSLQYPQTRIKRLGPDGIEDVYDESVYRSLSQEGGFLHHENNNMSFAIWTDEVDAAIASKASVWPIFIQILELSPWARQRYTILAGVYVGPVKPQMTVFLTPVCEQLRQLFFEGITWNPDQGPDEIRSRFVTLLVVADSEARYAIYDMMRHNSEYGCTSCYARAVNIADENAPENQHRHHHVYQWQDQVHDRTDEEIREDARNDVETNQPIRGVRGPSALAVVPGIDLRSSQRFDALHCFWEGNFKTLYKIWTSAVGQEYYFGPNSKTIFNRRLDNIKRTTKLPRHPRHLDYVLKYKASEFRNMAWFYWLPCAKGLMPVNTGHLEHFVKFANATYILCKDTVQAHEIDRADELLSEYCQEFAPNRLYPERYCFFNLHLLRHAARSVREWGPLWAVSAFGFESLNRRIRNFITSSNDKCSQIIDRFLLSQMIDQCMDRDMPPAVKNFIWDQIGGKR